MGPLPHDPDRDEQRRFLEEELRPRLEEAKQGKPEIWFMDASQFLYSAVQGLVWCLKRLWLPSPAGR